MITTKGLKYNEYSELSEKFKFDFESAGVMKDGVIYTVKTVPDYSGKQVTLGDIMEEGQVDEKYFIDPAKNVTQAIANAKE